MSKERFLPVFLSKLSGTIENGLVRSNSLLVERVGTWLNSISSISSFIFLKRSDQDILDFTKLGLSEYSPFVVVRQKGTLAIDSSSSSSNRERPTSTCPERAVSVEESYRTFNKALQFAPPQERPDHKDDRMSTIK